MVVDITAPLHEGGVCGLSDDILYIVLLICDNGIGLCDLARKCAVGPALAAFAAFPVLDIALMLVGSIDAGRLDGIVMDNDIGAGVCVLTKLIGLVAGLDESAAVFAVDIAAVAFAVDGGIDCIAGLFYQMIVGVGFTVGKAAGSADSRRLAVCRAAGVRAGILSGVANDAFLSMICRALNGELYPCVVMAGGLDGNIAFLAVLPRAVGVGVVLAAGGALIVRQVAILVAGRGGVSVLCKLGMLACILCYLGITAACLLGF